MSEIVEHLKRRIEETQKEYEDAGRKRIALRELEQKLFQELEAYKLALKAEMRRSGIVMPIAPKVGKPTVLPPSPKGHETESVKDLIASRIKDAGEGSWLEI